MSTIPQTAVTWLSEDPSGARKAAFDKQFGAGSADAALNPPKPEQSSWTDTAKAVAGDVGEGLLKSPVTVATGLFEGAVINPLQFISETITGDIAYSEEGGLEYLTPSEVTAKRKAGAKTVLENSADQWRGLVDDKSMTGALIDGVAKFSGAAMGVDKFFKGASFVETTGKAALATFAAYKGDEGRIADMLLEWGVEENAVLSFMATDPNDSEAMGRMKNMLEEGPLGVLGFMGVRLYKAMRAGDEKVIKEVLDDADAVRDSLANRPSDSTPATSKDAPEATSGDISEAKPVTESISAQMKQAVDAELEAVDPKPEGKVHKLTVEQHNAIDAEIDRALNSGETPKDMGWRNSKHINTLEDAEVEIATVRSAIAANLTSKPQNEKLWKAQADRAAKRLAKMANVSHEDVLATTSKLERPEFMAADLMAKENFAIAVSEKVREIAKIIRIQRDYPDAAMLAKAGYNSIEEAKMDLMKHRELAANIIAQAQGQRSNIARAMRAMQITRTANPALKKILKNEGETLTADADHLVDQLERLDNGGSPEEVISSITKAGNTAKQVANAINKFRINALLSGLGTQEINMVSNLINTVSLPAQQVIGGVASLDFKTAMHGLRTYRGMIGGSVDAVKSSLRALYNDDAILDPFNGKIDIPQGYLGTSKVMRTTDKIVSLPSRFLMGMDEFFKQASYRGRIYADAVHHADLENLKGAEKQRYIKNYIKDSFDDAGAATRGDALLQAQRTTFTEQLDGELSKMLQRAAVKSNTVRFVVPFVRTPINVLSQGFQQIPVLGVLSKRWRDDVAAGGPRRAQAIGKQAIGGALTITGLHLVSEGYITGSGPSDPAVRKQWLQTHQPYSFRITNEDGSITWQPYQRYEPASYVLALMADMGEIFGDDNISEKEKSEVAFAVAAAVAENTINKTFTQGIADFFELLTDKEGKKAETIGESLAGSFVPNAIPQALNQQEKLEIRGMMDSILSRVGMDGHIDRKRNFMGEIMVGSGYKMHPLGGKLIEQDDLQAEITRLSEVHKAGFDLPVSKVGEVELKDTPYSENQSMYDKWIELSGEIKAPRGPFKGMTMRQALEAVIKDERYATLRDGDETYDGANVKMLKKIARQYRDAAKKILAKENPAFKQIFLDHDNAKKALKTKKPTTLIEDINNGSR